MNQAIKHYFLSLRNAWKPNIHFHFAISLLLLSAFALGFQFGYWTIIFIVIADIYLTRMLWCATCLSAGASEPWPGLPTRKAAVGILPIICVAISFAFGAANLGCVSTSRPGAAYYGFVNLVTFDHPAAMSASLWGKFIMALQLVNSILLLICVFPLVVARITDLGENERTIKFNDIAISIQGQAYDTLTVDGEKLTWMKGNKKLEIAKKDDGLGVVYYAKSGEVGKGQKVIIESSGNFIVKATD